MCLGSGAQEPGAVPGLQQKQVIAQRPEGSMSCGWHPWLLTACPLHAGAQKPPFASTEGGYSELSQLLGEPQKPENNIEQLDYVAISRPVKRIRITVRRSECQTREKVRQASSGKLNDLDASSPPTTARSLSPTHPTNPEVT